MPRQQMLGPPLTTFTGSVSWRFGYVFGNVGWKLNLGQSDRPALTKIPVREHYKCCMQFRGFANEEHLRQVVRKVFSSSTFFNLTIKQWHGLLFVKIGDTCINLLNIETLFPPSFMTGWQEIISLWHDIQKYLFRGEKLLFFCTIFSLFLRNRFSSWTRAGVISICWNAKL